MANYKQGFNYYSVDTDRYQDMKIKRLKKNFGPAGIAVYDYLLCEIYRVKGCFIEWDENTAFDVADYFGIKESLVNEIVNYCGVVGLFNKELLTSESVLTSVSIQNRFLDWSKKARRTTAIIPEKLNILREESHKMNEEPNKTHTVCDEVKKSKVKESKKKKKKKEKFDFSFLPEKYKSVWFEWLDVKKDIGSPYKTQQGMQAAFTHLVNISGDDKEMARQIVEQSRRREWAGLFPLKEEKKPGGETALERNIKRLEKIKQENSMNYGTQ